MEENIICCPICNHSLDTVDEQSYCDNCASSFQNRDGILDFMPGNDFYWGEISQDKMQVINNQSVQEGNWFKVVGEQLDERPDLVQYFTDLSRLGWLFHGYKQGHNDVCVDIGSGLGSLSFKLSRLYNHVYSVDGVLDRLKFQVIRANEEHISNIHFIRSPLLKLPFHDGSVDLVVVNGVLEWVGLSDFSKRPDEIQMNFLKEINRILKPGGILYLGIENRFGAQYFTGRKDHSNLKYTSLLPRRLASLLLKYLYKKNKNNPNYYYDGFEHGYRTYTYSKRGYEKMLKKAGLPHVDSNWALPSYSFPQYSGPLDGDSIRYLLDYFSDKPVNKKLRLAFKLVSYLPRKVVKNVHELFMPDFLFIASKTPLEGTLPHQLFEKYPEMRSFVRMNTDITPELNTSLYVTNEKLKVTKALKFKEQREFGADLSEIAFQNSEVLDGRPFKTYKQEDILKAAEWLATLQSDSQDGYWSPGVLQAEITRLIINARELSSGTLPDQLDEYENLYLQSMKTSQLSVVTEHGDFFPHNILVEWDGCLKVVDWDQSKESGNPLMDVGSFVFSLLTGKRKNSLFDDIHSRKSISIFQERYLEKQNLPFNLAPAYYVMRLIERAQNSPNGSYDHIYIQDYWSNLLRLALSYSLSSKAPITAEYHENTLIPESNLENPA